MKKRFINIILFSVFLGIEGSSVLASAGWVIYTRWFVFHSSGGWEVQDQCSGWPGRSWVPPYWFLDSPEFHTIEEVRELPEVSYVTIIPFTRAAVSGPNTSRRPRRVMLLTLGSCNLSGQKARDTYVEKEKDFFKLCQRKTTPWQGKAWVVPYGKLGQGFERKFGRKSCI